MHVVPKGIEQRVIQTHVMKEIDYLTGVVNTIMKILHIFCKADGFHVDPL